MSDSTNTDDIIDVRDIIARVEELRESRDEYNEKMADETAWASVADGETEELQTLESLLEEIKGCGGDEQWEGDWYPVTLIRDSNFESAMDELLEDIGDLPKELPCYLTITVDYVALRMDYSSVEFDGVTYWYR